MCNSIFLNDFKENSQNAFCEKVDNGVWSNNYWDDYEEKYPDAKDENEDGFWDDPYIIYQHTSDPRLDVEDGSPLVKAQYSASSNNEENTATEETVITATSENDNLKTIR